MSSQGVGLLSSGSIHTPLLQSGVSGGSGTRMDEEDRSVGLTVTSWQHPNVDSFERRFGVRWGEMDALMTGSSRNPSARHRPTMSSPSSSLFTLDTAEGPPFRSQHTTYDRPIPPQSHPKSSWKLLTSLRQGMFSTFANTNTNTQPSQGQDHREMHVGPRIPFEESSSRRHALDATRDAAEPIRTSGSFSRGAAGFQHGLFDSEEFLQEIFVQQRLTQALINEESQSTLPTTAFIADSTTTASGSTTRSGSQHGIFYDVEGDVPLGALHEAPDIAQHNASHPMIVSSPNPTLVPDCSMFDSHSDPFVASSVARGKISVAVDLKFLRLMIKRFRHEGASEFIAVKPLLAVVCASQEPPATGLIAAALDIGVERLVSMVETLLAGLLCVTPRVGADEDGRATVTCSEHLKNFLKWISSTEPERVGREFWIDVADGHNLLCALYLRFCGNKSVAVEHTWQDYLRAHGPMHFRKCSRGCVRLGRIASDTFQLFFAQLVTSSSH